MRHAASFVIAITNRYAVATAVALHCAAMKGNIRLVKWLLRNGALDSIHCKNAMGCTPLDVARIFGPHPEVIACALNDGADGYFSRLHTGGYHDGAHDFFNHHIATIHHTDS